MIDIENDIFNGVFQRLKTERPEILVIGEYVRTPGKFPCVMLFEEDAPSYERGMTQSSVEEFTNVLYRAEIYSNREGKKTDCRKIAAIVDEEMLNYGFTRTLLQPVANLEDASVYRITARYKAVASKNKTIYRR